MVTHGLLVLLQEQALENLELVVARVESLTRVGGELKTHEETDPVDNLYLRVFCSPGI